MPVSKNRKGHAKKAIARKTREKERKAHLENMYKQMMEQLSDKNLSMTDMLNKEEAGPPSGPEQTSLGHDSKVTVTRNTTDESYTVVDMPESDPDAPIHIYSPNVVI